ncbi:hypothetical protein GGR01_003145 [Acetobacter oeni]|nr:hypothetical protein [Acetobacter oeni]
MFSKLKQFRRIATRYDKTRKSFHAFLSLAAVKWNAVSRWLIPQRHRDNDLSAAIRHLIFPEARTRMPEKSNPGRDCHYRTQTTHSEYLSDMRCRSK